MNSPLPSLRWGMSHPVQISCIAPNWRGAVVETLDQTHEAHEIDLVHFLFPDDAAFCQDIASKYSMNFIAGPAKYAAFFRKRAPGTPLQAPVKNG